MSNLLFTAAFSLYAVGLFHSVFAFRTKKDLLFRISIGAVTAGFVLHSIFLVVLGLELGHFPLTGLRESLTFFAWTVSLCFLISHWRFGVQALGLFSLPLVTLLMLSTAFFEREPPPDFLRDSWLFWHTTCLILAYGMLFVTFIASILYLVQQRDIKSRKPGIFSGRIPSLLTMDEILQKSLIWGFCFMSLGLLAGIVGAEKEWLQGWQTDPKVVSAFATWGIYLFLIYLRLSAGWRGKRVALMSLVGFASVLFTFLGTQLFFGGLHIF